MTLVPQTVHLKVRGLLCHPQQPPILTENPSLCGEAEAEGNIPRLLGSAASHCKGSDFWGSEGLNLG